MIDVIRPRVGTPDQVAAALTYAARIGRAMPPSWQGARISVPYTGPQGEYMGRILPGKGLYLDMDLKTVGITRGAIPHVYEKSPVQRYLERFLRVGLPIDWAERGAITTYDGIIGARAGGLANDIAIGKLSITTVASNWSTLFRAGGFPAAGTYTDIPGGAAHDRTNTGAWSVGLSNPANPNKKYLLTTGYVHSVAPNMILLVDLLVAAGGILATVNTAQTVNSAALTRYTDGKGVLMTFDVTTLLSNTAHNMQVNKYTNQDGTTDQDTGAVAGTNAAAVQRLVPIGLGPFMQLAAGDYGVRSVEEYTNSVALAAGVFALNLYFPLTFLPGIAANAYIERDSTVQIDGIAELMQTAGGVLGCLTAYYFATTTSSGAGNYFLRSCEG
jgi:hypothetical protein